MEQQGSQEVRWPDDQSDQEEVVCVNCGHSADDAFSQLGTLSAYRPVAVTWDGQKYVVEQTGRAELDDRDDWDSCGDYICAYCNHQGWKLDQMIKRLRGGEEVPPPNPNQLSLMPRSGDLVVGVAGPVIRQGVTIDRYYPTRRERLWGSIKGMLRR